MSNTILLSRDKTASPESSERLNALSRVMRLPVSKPTMELVVVPLVLSLLISVCVSYALGSMFHSDRDLPVWLRLLATLGIGSTSFLLGAKTRGPVRIAVLIQLCAVSLLVLNGFTMPSAPQFADVVAAVLCGGAASSLTAAFSAQQKKLEAQSSEITLRRRQLTAAKLALVKQDEVERRLLAADLHDQVLHDLKLVRQTLNGCKSQLDEKTADSLQTDLTHAMQAVREVMDQLFPSSLEHLGLVGALEECLDNAGRRCGFETFVRCKVSDDDLKSISKVEELLLFRLIQEAVNNIIKHAKAETVSCQIVRDSESLVIKLVDDGVGFTEGNSDGRGLRYMKQRAELVGANIAWLPGNNGRGTTVEIRLNRLPRDSGKIK